jgi:hypothetical protein
LAAICFSMALTNKGIMLRRELRNHMIFETRGIKID